ncbi:MAG: MFS transporter [Candidatus Lokiarchaeota archaeon]|nr:MFS transporter [Candidatus Lokiarchaeota archaeon]MBD3199289.1 MFS transporter [Candidatus Lokiarchaeota archaeon]
MNEKEKVPFKEKILFGISAIPDHVTYQGFSLLVFTYYFSVIELKNLVWIGFIIWSIWNMINDPVLGALSDRTKQRGKLGKRRFFMIISIVPLSLSMFFLFYVPFTTTTKILEFAYFLTVIIVFEFFYTLFDVNINAIFPEQFTTESKRAQTNIPIKAFTVVAVILAAVPTLTQQTPKETNPVALQAEIEMLRFNYIIWGIYLALVVIIFAIPFLWKGIKPEKELAETYAKRPGFFESLKSTLKNKNFVKFVIANTMIWYVFNTLITIFPLYFEHVIDISAEESFFKTLALVSALLVAAFVLPFHKWLGTKYGMRNAMMITMTLWIGLLTPFFFISSGDKIFGLIITAAQGVSLSGALFYVDILLGDIIDEDASRHGVKRSASFYGINALIHRTSTILTMMTIFIVFQGTDWAGGYTTIYDEATVELALKLIIFVFPSIGCLIGIVFLKSFSLHGKELEEMRERLRKYPELL